MDVSKPLLRWTIVIIEDKVCRISFRYEKLADFCYSCGRLDNVDRECILKHLEGKKQYGPWLRVNCQRPPTTLNNYEHPAISNRSPSTPNKLSLQENQHDHDVKPMTFNRQINLISVTSLEDNTDILSTNPLNAGKMTMQASEDLRPKGDILISKTTSWNPSHPNQKVTPYLKKEGACSSNPSLNHHSLTDNNVPLDLFDVSFLQNFTFSPTLSLAKSPSSHYGREPENLVPQNLNISFHFPKEELIPTDLLLQMFASSDAPPMLLFG